MSEYGIFSDEGCLEMQFYSRNEAEIASLKYVEEGEDGVHVSEICPDHPEQEREHCEECNAE